MPQAKYRITGDWLRTIQLAGVRCKRVTRRERPRRSPDLQHQRSLTAIFDCPTNQSGCAIFAIWPSICFYQQCDLACRSVGFVVVPRKSQRQWLGRRAMRLGCPQHNRAAFLSRQIPGCGPQQLSNRWPE
jgi:hypothetical protein